MDEWSEIRRRKKRHRRRVRNIRVCLTLFAICLIAIAIPAIRVMLRKPAKITVQMADIEITQGEQMPQYSAAIPRNSLQKNCKMAKELLFRAMQMPIQKELM